MSTLSSEDLLRRRERLLMRSSQLRVDMSWHVQGLRKPLERADQARDAVQWLARHPEWPLGVAVVIVLLRPRRALNWAGFAWQGYNVYRRVQRLMGDRGPRPL